MYYRRLLPVIAVATLLLFFIGCKRHAVVLSYTNAKGEMPLLSNLVFRFNQSMVSDSMLNNWDSTDYVSFEPAIPGRFRWESPDQLIFSPSQPLSPATSYKATIKKSVLQFSKYDKVEKADKIDFHTPDLVLDNSQVVWMGESSTTAVPQVDMQFNYRVSPAIVQEALKVEIDGQPADIQMITASPENKISFRIKGLRLEDKDYSARITLAKGLKPELGNNATDETITAALSIPSPFVLVVQQMESEHDGTEGYVRVMTSQQIVPEGLKQFIKFDPEVTYTTELTENGFLIRSDKFDLEKSYMLTVAKGLRGKIGGTLKEEYSQGVAFGELEANISFTNNKAVYLSRNGSKNLEVKITNVPKVKLVISKIYENNLVMAQYYGYNPREKQTSYASYDDEYYEEYDGGISLGDVIYEKEIDTRSLPRSGGGRLLNLSQFEDRLSDFKGIYHVRIRSLEDYWVSDSRFISLSDLGLIAKEGANKLYVFTNSIKTATPVGGVTVSVYSNNNQLIGTGASNAEGVAEIAYIKNEFSGFKPAMIIAKTADDFNYMPLRNTRVNMSRFDVGGRRNNPSGLDAYVYAERDIYRPGEKINFSVIIRDRQWKTPGEIPLVLKLLMPNGKEFKTIRKSLNSEGSVEGSFDIPVSAITGGYTLEVYNSTDVLLATQSFAIEEFVPDRIRVNASLGKNALKPGESTSVTVNAVNFFGPPAANRNYEMEIQVKQKGFHSEQFSDFNFALTNQTSFFDKVVRQGVTDANGNAQESYEVPAVYANMGLLQTDFYTTVFDETGRPVSRAASADIFTQDIFYGIKNDWNYYFPLNQPVKLELASVSKDGKPAVSVARVQVIKHEYNTVLAKSGNYFRYESQRSDKIMAEGPVNVGAKTVYTFIPRSPGDYEVRVYKEGANAYVSRSFYSYGSYGADNNSFEVNNEGHIDIEVNKKAFESGETVEALFKTPFSGKMLVTMETDHVVSHQYVEVSNRTATLKLKLSPDHVPNVYITATLIKPHEVSDIPLTVAHGFQNIVVEEKSRKIPVEIVSAKSVRSRTKQTIKVKAAPGSMVTLSAVDNGVLQVSNFKTPDPYKFFYQKKALQVAAYDIYPLLFAEVRARLSSTGGDGELDMMKRTNPMPARRVKVLSYWSGIKKAGSNGVAEFDVDVPAFSGELRLMAVSYKGQSFGASENTMTVADPVVISTALPRFLSPGDTVMVPVTLSNTTDKSAVLQANLSSAGAVKVSGAAQQQVTVAAKSEARVYFNMIASPEIGIGNVKVLVNGLGEKFEDATEISVRPPSTLQKMTGSGTLTAGTQKINIGTRDFIPGSDDYHLVISRSPLIELGQHLRYLVQYPYGCTEQTISSAFPQLYYGDMAELLQQGSGQKVNANSNVLEAIRKIKMRQLYNGALTLWDGSGKEDWWSTIYAAHFLLEAKRAGFDMDNSLLETMLNYINNRLKNRETILYYYNRDQNKKIAPKEVAYGLYVLALAGRPNVPAMNYYKSNPAVLALDSRYLLSAAYAKAGDKKSFAAILPASFTGEESVPQTGGSYYSPLRDEAIALNALIDIDPGHAQVPVMIKHVSDRLKNSRWLNTQERAFAFLAMGKHARSANQSKATAEIKVNGKLIAKTDGTSWRGDKNALKGATVDVATTGEGRLYYYWESSGISASGAYTEEDSYLKVRRRFYDRYGKPLTGNTFKQNDLIIIGITLEKNYSSVVENVVITDLLPAGFEIENPRTKEIPGMDWIKDGWTPTALDVRDDRIHFFVDATSNKQTYYYAVRAVSPGQYKMGPVSADAMYNGEYHSYHGAGVIKVNP